MPEACVGGINKIIQHRLYEKDFINKCNLRTTSYDSVKNDKELKSTLMKFRDDELDHLETGVEHDGENALGYEIMKAIVQIGCRTAIKISEKI